MTPRRSHSPRAAALVAAVVAAAVLGVARPASGQEPQRELTLEERVALLERHLTNLEARLDLRTTAGAGAPAGSARDAELAGRIDRLEREVMRIAADLQRVRQQLDVALREAGQARREATEAIRAARDAASRIR